MKTGVLINLVWIYTMVLVNFEAISIVFGFSNHWKPELQTNKYRKVQLKTSKSLHINFI